MSRDTVFWLDEEENAAYPEMMQLRFHGFEIDYMTDVDRALDRITGPGFAPKAYKAFVIDAHMPNFGDPRFERPSLLDRNLAGVRLCDILTTDYKEIWSAMGGRTLIYTMRPPSPRVESVRKFAEQHGAKFTHKTDDGQIYDHLKSLGWL